MLNNWFSIDLDVNSVLEGDSNGATVVEIRDGGRKEFDLRDKREELRALARGDFKVGSKTRVSRRG